MKSTVYIQEMLENFILNLTKQALFIKHYDPEEINKSDFLQLMPDLVSTTCLYHEFQRDVMYEAYEPFLDWTRYLYDTFYQPQMTPEEFLKKANVYSLHVEPFASYIRTGRCQRTEDCMYTELNFEKQNIISDFVNLFSFVASEHKLILIMCAFHLTPLSTIGILHTILKKNIPNLHFIILYNDTYYIRPYIADAWNCLITYAKDNNMLYEWGSFNSDITMHSVDEYVFDRNNIKRNISKLTNMYHTFALEDMTYFINDIYTKIEHNKDILPEMDAYEILKLYTLLNLCTNVHEEAILSCKLITHLAIFETDPYITYMYHYLVIKTQFNTKHMDIIKNSYDSCVSIARQLNDDFLLFYADLLYCMAQFGGWKDLFLCDFRIPVPEELLEQCEKYGFRNHLAYLYAMGFENDEDTVTAIATGKENSVYFAKGVQLAKQLGNTDFLMSAYMKNIIIYSDAGYHEYVYQMHKKRIETVSSDDRKLQAHMYLGIGYNCIILENYEKADLYFRDALHKLANEELADDCMDALYNICMNYFVIEDYDTVIPCVDLLLKMLNSLGYQNIMICNTSKLYAMLAISYFHLQDYYNAYHYLDLMDIYMNQFLDEEDHCDYKYWEEELFLYHYIKAILYEYEGNLDAGQKELDASYQFLWLLPGTIFYTYALYVSTQYRIYKKLGEYEKAESVMDTAISYYKKQGFYQCVAKLSAIRSGNTFEKVVIPFNEPDLWFDKLLSLANFAGTQNKLKYREKDIAFLTIWQENLNRMERNIDHLIDNAISIMQNSYSLSDVIMLKDEAGVHSILYNNSDISLSNQKITEIFNFFRQYKRGFLTNRIDKNFSQFMPIIEPFGKNHVVTMIGIPIDDGDTSYVLLSHVNAHRNFTGNRILLSNENFVTLKFAFNQLVDAIRQINTTNMLHRVNAELEKVSMTDYLTGIYNRHGLSYIMDTHLCKEQSGNNLILYIDLDNFKYYNDTYGHDVGDMLLVNFTRIFTELIGDEGYAVRYGGDEFIIVLPNKTEEYGLSLSNQIYERIADGFKDLLSAYLRKDIVIPPDKKISCSIGISQYSGCSHEAINEALNSADQALYFMKRNSKGRAMTWSKLKDFNSIVS